MKDSKIEGSDVRFWAHEIKRCEDFLYFHNKYVRKEGEPELTQDDWDTYKGMAQRARSAIFSNIPDVKDNRPLHNILVAFGLESYEMLNRHMREHPAFPNDCFNNGINGITTGYSGFPIEKSEEQKAIEMMARNPHLNK